MNAKEEFEIFYDSYTSDKRYTFVIQFFALLIFALFMVLIDKGILKNEDIKGLISTIRKEIK